MLLAINYRQNPLPLRLRPGRKALGKVFSFSAYQFSFQLINYFSRNLDKLLMGRYMSLSQLGYYDKSYRLMMLPLQNIAYVISPVMHPIFSEMQHDLKQLGASYLKVVRLLAFIGLPLSAVLFFTAQELVLIIFGDQWGAVRPGVPDTGALGRHPDRDVHLGLDLPGRQRHADALPLRRILGGAQRRGDLHRHLRIRHDRSRGLVHLRLVRRQLRAMLPRVVLPHAAHGVAPVLAKFPLAAAAHGTRRPAPGSSRMVAPADAARGVAHPQGDGGTRRMAPLCAPERRIRPERACIPAPRPQNR